MIYKRSTYYASFHHKMSCITYWLNTLINIIAIKYLKNSCIFLSTTSLGSISTNPVVKINEIDNNFLNFGCENIIIYENDTEKKINDFENQIKLAIQRYNHRKYLIFLQEYDENFQLYKSLHFVPNVLFVSPKIYEENETVIYKTCEVTFILYTHMYSGLKGNDKIYVLDYWFSKNQSFLRDANLYPDKISNLRGRTMKMATFTYKPYAIVGKSIKL